MTRQPLGGSSPRCETISLVTSALGRSGETKLPDLNMACFEAGLPSYHQHLHGGRPPRSGKSKRMRYVSGKVSGKTREATSSSTAVGYPSLRARKGMLT